MTTRRFNSADSSAAAAIVALARSREDDGIDPFPPSIEVEVLADAGARGKGNECHPRVAADGSTVVGYGIVDYSPDMIRAQLLGPIVHPDHRGKGHGKRLLYDLLDQARTARQKTVRACVAARNAAGRRLLEGAGFKSVEKHLCLRMAKPEIIPTFEVEGVTLRRMEYEDADEAHAYLRRNVPRTARQTRSLLKSDDYAVVLAFHGKEAVGVVEVEMRYGDPARVEFLEGNSDLLQRGLGNALFAAAVRIAFSNAACQHLEFLVPGGDQSRVDAHRSAGFRERGEFACYELKL